MAATPIGMTATPIGMTATPVGASHPLQSLIGQSDSPDNPAKHPVANRNQDPITQAALTVPTSLQNTGRRQSQQRRDAGREVCPRADRARADGGREGREAIDAAFWTMLGDAVKAHEGGATAADHARALSSATAYNKALEEEAAVAVVHPYLSV